MPMTAANAEPTRAARNAVGESRRDEMAGAMTSAPAMSGPLGVCCGGVCGVAVPVPSANAACTVWLAFMVTVHDPVPEQAPLQPAKLEPAAGVAVSVTGVPNA